MNDSLHPEELPREKLKKYGIENLTNYELIAILLNTGTKDENVIEISKNLTKKYTLEKLSKIPINQLIKERGLGFAKSCKLLAGIELGKRIQTQEHNPKRQINCASDVADLLLPKTNSLQQEKLYGLYLNTRKRLIKEEIIFVGSLTESLINPREIFKFALEEGASGIILAHNHPSGDSTPSNSDIQSTEEIIKIGKIMGIEILDHVILGKNNFWSLKENGFI